MSTVHALDAAPLVLLHDSCLKMLVGRGSDVMPCLAACQWHCGGAVCCLPALHVACLPCMVHHLPASQARGTVRHVLFCSPRGLQLGFPVGDL